MYTIGQFSKICKVTVRALHHYEKIGLLTPAKVEEGTNYRYYTSDQISLMKNISFMKKLGIPLKTAKQMIRKIVEKQDLEFLIEEHRMFLLKQRELCDSRLDELAWWQKSLEVQGMSDNTIYDIQVRDNQETYFYSVRDQLTSLQTELPELIRLMTDKIVSHGGVCGGPAMILHHDEEYNPKKTDIEVCLPVTNHSLANRTLRTVKAVACTYMGPYDELEKAYQVIFKWINLQGFKEVYPIREIFHNTPAEHLVTEIIVPIKPWDRGFRGLLCDDPYCVDPNCECQKKFDLYMKSLPDHAVKALQSRTARAREKKFDLYMKETGFVRASDSLPYKWVKIPSIDITPQKDGHSSEEPLEHIKP